MTCGKRVSLQCEVKFETFEFKKNRKCQYLKTCQKKNKCHVTNVEYCRYCHHVVNYVKMSLKVNI